MPRKHDSTLPPPGRITDLVLERRLISAFGGLLGELGLGSLRTDEIPLVDLLEHARVRTRALRMKATEAEDRAARLQAALSRPLEVVAEDDRRHLVQWRVLNAEDGVTTRSDWNPAGSPAEEQDRLYCEREVLMGEGLRLSRLVRCLRFEITSEARTDDEPPF